MNPRWMLTLLLLMTAFAGCVDDAGGDGEGNPSNTKPDSDFGGAIDETAYSGNTPTGHLPPTITGLSHLTNPDPLHAYSVFANDDVLYAAGDPGLRTFDISDPSNPQPLATEVLNSTSRDIDLMFHPDGNLYLVLANSNEDGVHLFNVNDPAEPEFVSRSEKCTHNVAVVPNTTLVYSSFSACHSFDMANGDNSHFAIVDFADPMNPQETLIEFPRNVDTVGGTPREVDAVSCHHTTFQMDRNLMYCAAITQTLIFDIEDPTNPFIIQVIDWAGNNIHHAVWPAHGGDLLLIGDEFNGALTASPTCSENADAPTSALWFYDLSDLSLPTPIGYFQVDHYESVNEQAATSTADEPTSVVGTNYLYCSTHFGGFVEDQDIFVISWYAAGTVLIDFSDPTTPQQIGEFRAEGDSVVTDAIYYKGHVYGADQYRGVDVMEVV